MTPDDPKLSRDVAILAAMSAEMDDYFRHEVLFWPMAEGNMPRLTLGGYFLRQHRLTALNNLLTPAEQRKVAEAIAQFTEVTKERVVAIEMRVEQELQVRLRHWQTSLRDWQEQSPGMPLYAAGVEERAMIAALLARFSQAPGVVMAQLPVRIAGLDQVLRGRFRSGDFVWPAPWQPAYPEPLYWWLYGVPV